MSDGEVVIVAIIGFFVLGFFFICFNNLKFKRKQVAKEKENKKKDTQPVADVSPKQVNLEKDLNAGEPLKVDDPIFSKKGYENITERADLKALIQEEKDRENQQIIEKFGNIQITDKPVFGDDEFGDMVSNNPETDTIDLEKIEQLVSEPSAEPKVESVPEVTTIESPKEEEQVDETPKVEISSDGVVDADPLVVGESVIEESDKPNDTVEMIKMLNKKSKK